MDMSEFFLHVACLELTHSSVSLEKMGLYYKEEDVEEFYHLEFPYNSTYLVAVAAGELGGDEGGVL